MTAEWAMGILSQVDCGAFKFSITKLNGAVYLQVGKGEQWGDKWPLTSDMSPTAVVYTAMNAVLRFTEQELRAAFRYKGSLIFKPWDPDAMAEARGLDARL